MKKAVIFDLDGTLLNTLDDICDSVNHALSEFGFKNRTIDEVRSFVGNGFERLIELALEGGKDNPEFPRVYELAKNWYASHAQIKTAAYEGITELLESLKEKGIMMGVVSNKPHEQVKYLVSLHFGNFVRPECAWGENEAAGIKRKPYPDCVNQVINTMGISKEDAVYCGDSDVDIKTARNAGLKCISVDWGFKTRSFLEQNGAETIISRPSELLEKIS